MSSLNNENHGGRKEEKVPCFKSNVSGIINYMKMAVV
jgi:hypothetical protein